MLLFYSALDEIQAHLQSIAQQKDLGPAAV